MSAGLLAIQAEGSLILYGFSKYQPGYWLFWLNVQWFSTVSLNISRVTGYSGWTFSDFLRFL